MLVNHAANYRIYDRSTSKYEDLKYFQSSRNRHWKTQSRFGLPSRAGKKLCVVRWVHCRVNWVARTFENRSCVLLGVGVECSRRLWSSKRVRNCVQYTSGVSSFEECFVLINWAQSHAKCTWPPLYFEHVTCNFLCECGFLSSLKYGSLLWG